MIRRMTVPNLIRVRGVDADGHIRQTRVFQQRPAAIRFAQYLHDAGYIVRMESARNIEFKLLGEYA
jgi:hypothetical protein